MIIQPTDKPVRTVTVRAFILFTFCFMCISTFIAFEVAKSYYSSKQVCLCPNHHIHSENTFHSDTNSEKNIADKTNAEQVISDQQNSEQKVPDQQNSEQKVPEQPNSERTTLSNFTSNDAPLLVICLHTCETTYPRIAQLKELWADHPLIKSHTILVETIVPQKIRDLRTRDENNFKQVVAGCGNDRISAVCRFQRAYELFIENHPNVPWMITADDDTWFDIDNLYEYIQNLMKIHDPMKELVVKGHANLQKTILHFLHGGCGWLMSNQYLRFKLEKKINLNDYLYLSRYRQPDTSEAIILRHVFKNISDWDEYYFQGFECRQCPVFSWVDSKFEALPECEVQSSRRYGKLNKIISFHTIGLQGPNFKLAHHIKEAPDWALYYRDNPPQSMYMCKAKGGEGGLSQYNIVDYTLDSMKKREVIYHPDDIKLPLIDFTTYRDEHREND